MTRSKDQEFFCNIQ